MEPQIYCDLDGESWFGLKREWRNKRAFALGVFRTSDSFSVAGRPMTRIIKATRSVRLKRCADNSECSCPPDDEYDWCEFDYDHLHVDEDGEPGYQVDLTEVGEC